MLILGLDPGSLHTGYGLVEKHGAAVVVVDAGRISCPRTAALPARLAFLVSALGELLLRHPPQLAALETPFHGRNVHSLIVLTQARGALLAALAGRGIEIAEYSPAEVKSAVTGNGRADKEQVARMVTLLLRDGGGRPGAAAAASRRVLGADRGTGAAAPRQGGLPADATDALAIALCCAQRLRLDRLRAVVPAPAGPA